MSINDKMALNFIYERFYVLPIFLFFFNVVRLYQSAADKDERDCVSEKEI